MAALFPFCGGGIRPMGDADERFFVLFTALMYDNLGYLARSESLRLLVDGLSALVVAVGDGSTDSLIKLAVVYGSQKECRVAL
jgi:hypothetical protein